MSGLGRKGSSHLHAPRRPPLPSLGHEEKRAEGDKRPSGPIPAPQESEEPPPQNPSSQPAASKHFCCGLTLSTALPCVASGL